MPPPNRPPAQQLLPLTPWREWKPFVASESAPGGGAVGERKNCGRLSAHSELPVYAEDTSRLWQLVPAHAGEEEAAAAGRLQLHSCFARSRARRITLHHSAKKQNGRVRWPWPGAKSLQVVLAVSWNSGDRGCRGVGGRGGQVRGCRGEGCGRSEAAGGAPPPGRRPSSR